MNPRVHYDDLEKYYGWRGGGTPYTRGVYVLIYAGEYKDLWICEEDTNFYEYNKASSCWTIDTTDSWTIKRLISACDPDPRYRSQLYKTLTGD